MAWADVMMAAAARLAVGALLASQARGAPVAAINPALRCGIGCGSCLGHASPLAAFSNLNATTRALSSKASSPSPSSSNNNSKGSKKKGRGGGGGATAQKWKCRSCGNLNPFTTDVCTKCSAKRLSKQEAARAVSKPGYQQKPGGKRLTPFEYFHGKGGRGQGGRDGKARGAVTARAGALRARDGRGRGGASGGSQTARPNRPAPSDPNMKQFKLEDDNVLAQAMLRKQQRQSRDDRSRRADGVGDDRLRRSSADLPKYKTSSGALTEFAQRMLGLDSPDSNLLRAERRPGQGRQGRRRDGLGFDGGLGRMGFGMGSEGAEPKVTFEEVMSGADIVGPNSREKRAFDRLVASFREGDGSGRGGRVGEEDWTKLDSAMGAVRYDFGGTRFDDASDRFGGVIASRRERERGRGGGRGRGRDFGMESLERSGGPTLGRFMQLAQEEEEENRLDALAENSAIDRIRAGLATMGHDEFCWDSVAEHFLEATHHNLSTHIHADVSTLAASLEAGTGTGQEEEGKGKGKGKGKGGASRRVQRGPAPGEVRAPPPFCAEAGHASALDWTVEDGGAFREALRDVLADPSIMGVRMEDDELDAAMRGAIRHAQMIRKGLRMYYEAKDFGGGRFPNLYREGEEGEGKGKGKGKGREAGRRRTPQGRDPGGWREETSRRELERARVLHTASIDGPGRGGAAVDATMETIRATASAGAQAHAETVLAAVRTSPHYDDESAARMMHEMKRALGEF